MTACVTCYVVLRVTVLRCCARRLAASYFEDSERRRGVVYGSAETCIQPQATRMHFEENRKKPEREASYSDRMSRETALL